MPAFRLVPNTPTLTFTSCTAKATARAVGSLRGVSPACTPSACSAVSALLPAPGVAAREKEDDRRFHWRFYTGFGRTGFFRVVFLWFVFFLILFC